MMKRMKSSDSLSKNPHQETPKLDRLTPLPEIILLHILSFLPTEEVIKTCILSKQWQCLWPSIPTLIFSHRNLPENELGKFMSFIDKTLALIDCTRLKKFAVDFAYHTRFSSDVNVWLKFVLKRKVEEVELDFLNLYNSGLGMAFQIPQCFYDNMYFVKLNLRMCRIERTGSIHWKSLKSLNLGSMALSNDVIKKIIMGSPVLEVLELCDCWGFEKLEIDGCGLKKLVINGYLNRKNEYSGLVICAPKLECLEILGCLQAIAVQLENLSVTIEVKIDCYLTKVRASEDELLAMGKQMVNDTLASLQHVRDISLGTRYIEVLSKPEMKTAPLSKCKCLLLHAPIQERYLGGIISLLQNSADLETLIINIAPPVFEFETGFTAILPEFQNFSGEIYWLSNERLFRCLDLPLKTIRISGFQSWTCKLELPFLRFLLKCSTVLEKMIIRGMGVGRAEREVAQSLLSFPRTSRNAVITFMQ